MDPNTILIISIVSVVNILSISATAFLRKKFENYATKQDVQVITSKVENVKKDLQIIVNEHQIRYSKLHLDRAKFLKELYKKLFELKIEIFDNTNKMMDLRMEERKKVLFKSLGLISEFDLYYTKNDILSTEKIDKLINSFLEKYKDFIWKIKAGSDYKEFSGFNDLSDYQTFIDKGMFDQSQKILEEAFDEMKKNIPKLNTEIKDEFKKLLGSD